MKKSITSETKGGHNRYKGMAQNLARSIFHWLCYVKNSTNSNVLLESSVRFPLVEYLERREGIKTVNLEKDIEGYSHRAFDFYFENTYEEEDQKTKKVREKTDRFYLEIKFVSIDTGDGTIRQKVFNDLSRLRYFAGEDSYCFFIMCGPTKFFETSFRSVLKKVERGKIPTYKNKDVSVQNNSIFNKWFSFDIKKPHKSIDIGDVEHLVYSNRFNTEYNDGPLESMSFKSTLIQLFPNGNDSLSPESVGIWQITKP